MAWHVCNEYGGACWCPACGTAFRDWPRKRYGRLDRLDHAWNTTFWSHTFTDWEQVPPPNAVSEHWRGPNRNVRYVDVLAAYHRALWQANVPLDVVPVTADLGGYDVVNPVVLGSVEHEARHVPDVEVVERVTAESVRHLFLLNHSGSHVTVPCPADGVDLFGGGAFAAGGDLVLAPTAVVPPRCQ